MPSAVTAAVLGAAGRTGGSAAPNPPASSTTLPLQGTVRYVNGFNQSAIQSAINAANSGDTVFFNAGTYTVNSNIQLESGVLYHGDTGAILHSTSVISIFNTQSNVSNTKLDGLTFDNGNVDFGGDNVTSSGAIIVNCTFQNLAGNDYGRQSALFLHPLTNSRIEHNTFKNLSMANGTETQGIVCYGPSNISISYNTFSNVYQGLHMEPNNTTGIVINNNTMTGLFRMGIEVQGETNGLKVQNNDISGWSPLNNRNNNKIALSIVPKGTGGTDISGNYLHDPNVAEEPGIEFSGVNGLIHDNHVVGFGDGVLISIGTGSSFYNNTISGFRYNAFGRDGDYTGDQTIGTNTINGTQRTGYNI